MCLQGSLFPLSYNDLAKIILFSVINKRKVDFFEFKTSNQNGYPMARCRLWLSLKLGML